MKLILNKNQLRLIESYINEVRKAPEPQKLSLFFNDNPQAKFFSVVSRLKSGSDDEYDFQLDNINGYKTIKDINKGTKTKNCSIDARFDTMIYGNTLSINFGKCGTLTINNVVGLKIYNNIDDLKNNKPSDSFELDFEEEKPANTLVDDYFNQIKKLRNGDEFHLDSKFKFDGKVLEKTNSFLRGEIVKHGSNSKASIITIDLTSNPFYLNDDSVFFKADVAMGEEPSKNFVIPIKKFFIDTKNSEKADTLQHHEPINTVKGDENWVKQKMIDDGKKALQMILNDPDLKKAFYSQPTLWNLFMAELKGKEASGEGIMPTLKILNNYEQRKISNKLNATFRKDEVVNIGFVDTVKIPYTKDGEDLFYTFDSSSVKTYKLTVLERHLGEEPKLSGGLTRFLHYELEIVDKLYDIKDGYLCKITMIVSKQSEVTRYPYSNPIKIQFKRGVDSPGYEPLQDVVQKNSK